MGVAMKVGEGLGGDASLVRHCSARPVCPLGSICGAERPDGGAPLYPTLLTLDQGELLWTDQRFEQRAFCLRQGIFSCVANLEQEHETPFALYGRGYCIGFGELYIPRKIASTYYLRALTPGMACSFHAKALRHHLEALPPERLQLITCSVLTNLSAASYTQLKMVSRTPLADRIAMLFIRLRDIAASEGRPLDEVNLTHGEIATLTASDRVSSTRVLHKMEEEGLIELGYRSIRLNPALEEHSDLVSEMRTEFHIPS